MIHCEKHTLKAINLADIVIQYTFHWLSIHFTVIPVNRQWYVSFQDYDKFINSVEIDELYEFLKLENPNKTSKASVQVTGVSSVPVCVLSVLGCCQMAQIISKGLLIAN